jgi:putative ABC transport system ATP-binding protein
MDPKPQSSSSPSAESPPSRGGPAPIELLQVCKTYRMGEVEVRALDDLTLRVEDGEFVAVMGSSGSGKSTLMNIVGCLDRPTSGSCLLLGQEVSRLSRAELAAIRNRTLGFVFQSFNLLSRTSALENVELPLLYAGVPGRERRQRARAALARVGLAERERHHPSQLSGGQQQRVALARALVGSPSIILADEPTGNLDSKTRVEVMELLSELNRSGITIVMVTHEQEVTGYASRVVILRDGAIESDRRKEPGQAAIGHRPSEPFAPGPAESAPTPAEGCP